MYLYEVYQCFGLFEKIIFKQKMNFFLILFYLKLTWHTTFVSSFKKNVFDCCLEILTKSLKAKTHLNKLHD